MLLRWLCVWQGWCRDLGTQIPGLDWNMKWDEVVTFKSPFAHHPLFSDTHFYLCLLLRHTCTLSESIQFIQSTLQYRASLKRYTGSTSLSHRGNLQKLEPLTSIQQDHSKSPHLNNRNSFTFPSPKPILATSVHFQHPKSMPYLQRTLFKIIQFHPRKVLD